MDMRDRIKERLGDKILEWKENSKSRVYFTVSKKDIFEAVKFLFRD